MKRKLHGRNVILMKNAQSIVNYYFQIQHQLRIKGNALIVCLMKRQKSLEKWDCHAEK